MSGNMRRTRSCTRSVKPNVLFLGVSYPCLAGQLAKRGVAVTPLDSPPTAAAVIDSVEQGVLTQMDGRDLLRCIETERACNVNVFCVSREQAAVYRRDRHLDANFNRSSSFVKVLKRQFGEERRYQQVVLDWFWIPPGWDDSHWSRTFFVSTLSLLARDGRLEENGRVFLPFCFHCFKEVIGSFDSLRLYYNVSFLRKDDLDSIALWKGTKQIDPFTMQHTLGKDIEQEEVYCTFGPRHLQSMNESFVSKQELLDVVSRLEDFHRVRFIALDLINETSRKNGHMGTIMGLQDQSTIQRGLTSPIGCIASESNTAPMTQQPLGSRRRLFTTHRKRTRSPLCSATEYSASSEEKALPTTVLGDCGVAACPTKNRKLPRSVQGIGMSRVVTPSSRHRHRRSPRLQEQPTNNDEPEQSSSRAQRNLFPLPAP